MTRTIAVSLLCLVLVAGTSLPQSKARSRAGSLDLKRIDTTPPQIELLEPVQLSTRGLATPHDTTGVGADSSAVQVVGRAEDSSGVAVVTVNGREASLTPQGNGVEFRGDALLAPGKNVVEVRAIDTYHNEQAVRFTVYRKSVEVPAKRTQVWAVVIGISQYQNPGIPPLRYADRDAEALWGIMSKPLKEGGFGIPLSNIRFLTNEQATSTNVREALTDFLKGVIEDDIVYIFFAGHGAPDPDRPKVLYLLTYDSDLNRLAATSVKMQEIQDAMRDYIVAKTIIVFVDACHSRGVGQRASMRGLAESSLVDRYLSDLGKTRASTLTFSASDANQLSQEDKRWGGGHGVFTHYILEGLKGAADSDHDGIVRLGELVYYVSDNVRRDTRAQQSPIPSGSYDLNLPLTIVK